MLPVSTGDEEWQMVEDISDSRELEKDKVNTVTEVTDKTLTRVTEVNKNDI